MSEFFFVLKTFVATLVFIVLLQIKVGGVTLENRFHSWVKTSSFAQEIQAAASGAALFIENSSHKVYSKINEQWEKLGSGKN